MPPKPNLTVVTDKTPKTPKRRLTVTKAASDGSRRDLLEAMRARVATAVEDPNTPARDLAALTRRLMEIAKDIEAIDVASKGDDDDGIAADEAWDSEAL